MCCPDTLFIGRNFVDLPSVNSTNEYAHALLSKSKPPEGTVISATNQYAGRGQIGSEWESRPGQNITLSIVLYPTFLPIRRQFLLNQAISLATFDLVEKYFPKKTKIKWPNDIYINDKKTAGILIQNAVASSRLRSSVVGIGININQEIFDPSVPNATSFKLESGQEMEIKTLIAELCQFVESRYLKLKSGKSVPLQQEYLQHLYWYGTEGLFQKPDGHIFKGIVKGISDIGKLQIEVLGKIETFGFKEIRACLDFHD